jgi:hypothetical protein
MAIIKKKLHSSKAKKKDILHYWIKYKEINTNSTKSKCYSSLIKLREFSYLNKQTFYNILANKNQQPQKKGKKVNSEFENQVMEALMNISSTLRLQL